MQSRRHLLVAVATVAALGAALARADEPAPVRVSDGGRQVAPASWECTPGHQVAKHQVTLQSGPTTYAFVASGCQDPSHEGKHPCAEGNFGMPLPTTCNWYWGGFLRILVNGSDATVCDVHDFRVLEAGERGSFQIVWSHPDAEVGLRLMLRAGSNHIDAQLVWKPREGDTVESVVLSLTCYPSYFTAANHRQGERHCRTPRTDQAEVSALELSPTDDTWLCYYDTVFDVAHGEGAGPCALLLDSTAVRGGKVEITGYPELTTLELAPELGEARLSLYDFTGSTNVAAEDYLWSSGAQDLADLRGLDFRPAPASQLDAAKLRAEALDLLAKAGDDGETLRPLVLGVLEKATALKAAADAGDWVAEGDLCGALVDSRDLFWKLRTFAALNSPEDPLR